MGSWAVRELRDSEHARAMKLVWRVFSEFEAPDYSAEGIEEFRRYIQPGSIGEQVAGDEPVSLLAVRPPLHISLLFIDKRYHRQGCTRALWDAARRALPTQKRATVNSSPYALEAYRRLGFRESGPEQTVNGLRFTPMDCELGCSPLQKTTADGAVRCKKRAITI